MRFVNPSLLMWAALIAVPIVLYLVRPRPRTVRVSTLPFFKSLHRAHQESSWLRRLKQFLSLLLSVLVIAAAVAALARPIVAPSVEALRTIVVLVDRSASMQAAASGGGSRLERGLGQVRARLLGSPGDPSVIVMAYDRRPEILLSASHDRRVIGRALDRIVARPMAGDRQRALQLAGELAGTDRPAVIWHVTDQQPRTPAASAKAEHDQEALKLADGVRLETIIVGHPQAINVGITALELRRAPQSPSEFDAFVQVESSLPQPGDAELEVLLDGALIDLRKLTLSPHRPERLLLPLKADAAREAVLAVRIKLPGDMLAVDNVAYAQVPRAVPLKVLWLTKDRDPFTETALGALGEGYEVLVGGPKDWPPAQPVDAAIFDGWLPEPWPRDLPAIVIDPPASFGPVRVARLQKPPSVNTHVRATDAHHPVLYGVANDRIVVAQTAIIDAQGQLEPLWLAATSEPVLLAGRSQGQSLVVMGFEPGKSESLSLLPSYPLLLASAINWSTAATLEARSGRNQRTGDLVELKGHDVVTWADPGEAKSATAPSRESVAGHWYELDRIGSWRAESGASGTASLLSAAETRLTADKTNAESAPQPVKAWHWPAGDLSVPLVWGLLGLLLAESWLFHRQAVY
jgi:hypothetical protein